MMLRVAMSQQKKYYEHLETDKDITKYKEIALRIVISYARKSKFKLLLEFFKAIFMSVVGFLWGLCLAIFTIAFLPFQQASEFGFWKVKNAIKLFIFYRKEKALIERVNENIAKQERENAGGMK